jgi:hypothetical protein
MKTCDRTNEQLAAFVLGYFSEKEVSDMTRHLVRILAKFQPMNSCANQLKKLFLQPLKR